MKKKVKLTPLQRVKAQLREESKRAAALQMRVTMLKRAQMVFDYNVRTYNPTMLDVLVQVVEVAGPPFGSHAARTLNAICMESKVDSGYSIIEHIRDLRALADEAIAARAARVKSKPKRIRRR